MLFVYYNLNKLIYLFLFDGELYFLFVKLFFLILDYQYDINQSSIET